jgi:hypothetical protein
VENVLISNHNTLRHVVLRPDDQCPPNCRVKLLQEIHRPIDQQLGTAPKNPQARLQSTSTVEVEARSRVVEQLL